ncbi:hypothetical protein [Smaragdicoccus niigatensis]|uniref:hypothetical protein n=1 Tax=Smaragdicoccus niigatensis TaxID=359359 RepID=UPI00035C1C2B|nr:hypothetical protein [Smaragdicoccus niigatensis]
MRSVRLDLIGGTSMAATAQLRSRGIDFHLTTTANVTLANHADAWLPLAIPVAMRTGSEIESNSAPSPTFVANAVRAQEVLHAWWPDLDIVGLPPAGAEPAVTDGRGIGSFFSGGVDSFFTAHRHADQITHLIFVTGFDISVAEVGHAQRSVDNARAAAAAMGKQLIVVSADLRKLGGPHALDWGYHFHGVAMAHVAHLLSDHLHTIYIPSSYSTEDQVAWGSAEALDPLWSSSRMRIIHDGGPSRRHDKVVTLVDDEVAMSHLRVCWERSGEQLNCGECLKCVRTAISIRSAGGRCATLPSHIGVLDIARLPFRQFVDPDALWRLRIALTNSRHRNRPVEIALAGAEAGSRVNRALKTALVKRVTRARVAAMRSTSG